MGYRGPWCIMERCWNISIIKLLKRDSDDFFLFWFIYYGGNFIFIHMYKSELLHGTFHVAPYFSWKKKSEKWKMWYFQHHFRYICYNSNTYRITDDILMALRLRVKNTNIMKILFKKIIKSYSHLRKLNI